MTVLRVAEVVGPAVDSPLARYLSLPLVPTALGFNPRLQVVHADDAAAALAHAALVGVPGTFNVAGPGTVRLHRLLRLVGRRRLPVPGPALDLAVGLLGRTGARYLPRELRRLLRFGRGVDVRAAEEVLGFRPRHTSEEAARAVGAAGAEAGVTRPARSLAARLATGARRP